MSEEQKKKPNGCLITVLVAIGVFLLLGALASRSDNNGNSGTEQLVSTTEKQDLELIDSGSKRDEFGNLYITGTIKNNTNKQYKYVQVEINLYDGDGAQIGSTLANTNNLEPGGTWKFKAVALEDGAKSYKIKDVTGF